MFPTSECARRSLRLQGFFLTSFRLSLTSFPFIELSSIFLYTFCKQYRFKGGGSIMSFEEIFPNERLRHARYLKGWTQSDLAAALDTDFETVSRWERGIAVPGLFYREKLCELFAKSAEELGLDLALNEQLTPFPLVFLTSAYADAEQAFVAQLKAHLHVRGITIWSSRMVRRHGAENKRKALQEAVRAAQVILLIVTPETRSSRYVQDTLQIANIYKRPVCAVWIDGEQWQECISKACGELYAQIDARQRRDQTLLDEIVEKLEAAWRVSDDTPATDSLSNQALETPMRPRNPYKGLNAFRSEDRHDFFGRDILLDELTGVLDVSLNAQQNSHEYARLLAVVGPSGSGKSSVVMAGLLPRLQAGSLPGSQELVYLDPILPGVHPIESLAVSLAKHLPYRSFKTIRDDLEDDSAYGLHLLTSYLGKPPERRVVLFIDQFEEVFTQTTSEEERQHFLDLLVTAVTESRGLII